MRGLKPWALAAVLTLLSFAAVSCATLSEPLGAKPDPFPALDAKPDPAAAAALYNTYKVVPNSVGARVGLRSCSREDVLAYMRESGSRLDLGGYQRGQAEDDLGSTLFVFLAIPAMLAGAQAQGVTASSGSLAFQASSSAAREFSQAVEAFNRELAQKLDLRAPSAAPALWPSVDALVPLLGPNAAPEDWVRAYQVRYFNGDPTVLGRSTRDVAAYMAQQGEDDAAREWKRGERKELHAVWLFAAAATAALWASIQHDVQASVVIPIYGISTLSFALGHASAQRGEHVKDGAREAFNRAMERKVGERLGVIAAH